MLRWLRGWLGKKRIDTELPYPQGTPQRGRSRFLKAKFRDAHVPAGFRVGVRRELGYRLYLPGGSSRRDSLPLIVMLHGCRQDSLSLAGGARMNALAEEGRCAVLYPEQSRRANPLRCWNWFEPESLAGQGEAALIARLIDQVTERRPIDPRRVYVVGISAGGAMACILAVRHSRLFAACAIHSGVMYGAASSIVQALAAMRSGPSDASIDKAWQLVREAGESGAIVPTLVIHGDRDATVNPVNADSIVEQLRARAEYIDPGAAPLPSAERRRESGGRTYRQQDYTQHGRVVLRKVLIEGLGHAWSGGDAQYEFNDAAGPEASRLILDFATRHHREIQPIASPAPNEQESIELGGV